MSDAAPPMVPDAVLDDLRRRLRAFRPVPVTGEHGWARGTEPAFLAELVAWWAERYDWRPHEARIRALPWVDAGADGGTRAIHRRADDPGAPVVVLLHGWPDSVLRYERVLALLDDVHVVVPCLPGYPFATAAGEDRSTAAMARVVAATLAHVGHERWVVSGGDIGGSVAELLALAEPERVAALHLTDVPSSHLRGLDPAAATEPERRLMEQAAAWQRTEGAYMHMQATRPHTVTAALGDSPAGLAAWIVEKLRAWSDCDGDVASVWSRDELLTWITAYWVTGAIGTSFGPYADGRDPLGRVPVPTVVSRFRETLDHPRELAERAFDLRAWREHDRGGHFAAWEQPDAFVADLREAIALAR